MVAENNLDLSAAVEQLQTMLQGEEGQQTLKNIMGMFGGEEKPHEPGMTTGGIDPESLAMVMRVKQMMDASEGQNRAQVQLLHALRPFLSATRREKVDSAMQLVRMSHVLGAMKELRGNG